MSGEVNRGSDAELHYVAPVDEIDVGDHVVVDVHEREVAVYNVNGEYFAILNYCVHQGGPLAGGQVSGLLTETPDRRLCYERENEIVACPWHGWEFDITTGEHVARPKYRVPTYDVVVEDGSIYVSV